MGRESGAGLSLRSELGELAKVYRRVPAGDVLSLWRRRARLSASGLLPKSTGTRTSRPRIVVSLTTIPSRISRIKGVLNSLIEQTEPADAILLAVPQFSRREQSEYRIPAFIAASSAITLLRCDDWGPATKLIPRCSKSNNRER